MVSETARAAIDDMTKQELREELELGNRSRFRRANFAYLKARYANLCEAETAETLAVESQRREEELELARRANKHGAAANRLSKMAIGVSVLALLVAI